jgi:hypothetical protein
VQVTPVIAFVFVWTDFYYWVCIGPVLGAFRRDATQNLVINGSNPTAILHQAWRRGRDRRQTKLKEQLTATSSRKHKTKRPHLLAHFWEVITTIRIRRFGLPTDSRRRTEFSITQIVKVRQIKNLLL